MKKLLQSVLILALAFLSGSSVAKAQDSATKQIEGAIHQFYRSLSLRDVQALREVVDGRFIIVAAGRADAKAGVLDAGNPAELLPPEGNNDWKNVRVSSIAVHVSATDRSVATASFTLIQPLDQQKVTTMKAALKRRPPALSDAERKAAEKRIAEGAIQNTEFAMLIRHGGKWRIVSISVPH